MTGNAVETPELSIKDIDDGEFKQTARSYKEWVIITFQKGDQKAEYSYSNTLSQEDLNFLIERDREVWSQKISN